MSCQLDYEPPRPKRRHFRSRTEQGVLAFVLLVAGVVFGWSQLWGVLFGRPIDQGGIQYLLTIGTVAWGLWLWIVSASRLRARFFACALIAAVLAGGAGYVPIIAGRLFG